jgi:DNA polymerase III delta prime subunit
MKFIFEIKDQDVLNHFYLVKSNNFDIPAIKSHFDKVLVSEFEIFDFNYDTILVDQAREIIDLANRKISDSKKSFFFIKTNSMTHQAQNSLLKSLEEPTSGLHFFFVLPELKPNYKSSCSCTELYLIQYSFRHNFMFNIYFEDTSKNYEMIQSLEE